MKRLKSIVLLFLGLVLTIACDDNTGNLGNSITPENDKITTKISTYKAISKSVLNDSVLGKTDKVYLGRFTDPQTGSMFEADFMSQLNCVEGGNVFPPIDSIKGGIASRTELKLYYSSFFGDSTATMKLEVFELSEVLNEGQKHYTNVDPSLYYNEDAEPLVSMFFTPIDYTLDDDVLADDNHYANINIPLPDSIGTNIINLYEKHPEYFDNASNFIENICKGYYIKCSQGDGTVLYIDQVALCVYFDFLSSDSTYVTQFVGSQEVLQINRFTTDYTKNNDLLDNTKDYTYLKTPAGIITEVTLPIDEITKDILERGDSINSSKIVFTRYNESYETNYAFGTPQTLLMVPKKAYSENGTDMINFFEKNKLTDNITSYHTTFDAKYNQYTFNNIARLITYCINERKAWELQNDGKDYEKEHPDWNKVVLIPVTTIKDSNNSIVNFRHDFSLNSTRLVGGTQPIEMTVISSSFN